MYLIKSHISDVIEGFHVECYHKCENCWARIENEEVKRCPSCKKKSKKIPYFRAEVVVTRGQETRSFIVFKKDFARGTSYEIKSFDLDDEKEIDLELNTKFEGKICYLEYKQKSIIDAEEADTSDEITIAEKFSVSGCDHGSYEYHFGDKQCKICDQKFKGKENLDKHLKTYHPNHPRLVHYYFSLNN